MKKICLLSFVIALFLSSCGGQMIFFEQTCIECVKSQWLLGEEKGSPTIKYFSSGTLEFPGVIIPETGEIIELTEILLHEYNKDDDPEYSHLNVIDRKIAIAKFRGKYYLTGDKFSSLWILTPAEQNQASLERIPFPEKEGRITSPSFEIEMANGRMDITLILCGKNWSDKYFLNSDNELKRFYKQKT